MNPKAQSALEYLMTYGWTLLVVVLVMSVIVTMGGPPELEAFRCISSDEDIQVRYTLMPTSYLKDQKYGENGCGQYEIWDGNILLRNNTGSPIQIIEGRTEGYFHSFGIKGQVCDPETEWGYTDPAKLVPPHAFSETNPLSIETNETFSISSYVNDIFFCEGSYPNGPRPLIARVEGYAYPMPNFCGSTVPYPGENRGRIIITYRTGKGFDKNVTITCMGWPSTTVVS